MMLDKQKENLESDALRRMKASKIGEITYLNYKKHLDQFKKYTNLTEDQILKLDIEPLQNYLEDWVMSLGERGLKGSSTKKMLSGVEKFLDMNRKLYHKKALSGLIRENENESDEVAGGVPYTSDEIADMVQGTKSLRNKALVYVMATGMRPAGFTDPILRMKHLSIQYEENGKDSGCYALRVYDNSPDGYSENSKSGYWVFLTPEQRKALDRYHRSRKLNGEVFDKETPLFTVVSHTNPRPMKLRSIYSVMGLILKNSGVVRTKIDYRYDKAINYAFRKRFNTILKLGDSKNANIAEKLMHHKRGLDGTYLKPTREECFAEFKKAVFELTISDSERKSVKIQKLEVEKIELEKTNQKLEDTLRKVDELWADKMRMEQFSKSGNP